MDNNEPNTEYTTLPAGSEPPAPADDGGTPEPDPAPAPAPQPSAPNPEFEALKAEMAAMREREREYLALLGRQPQAAQQPATPEPSYRDIAAQYFGEKSVDGLDKLLAAMEARIAKKYAPREDLDQVRNATSMMVASTVEQKAMDGLRAMKVPDSDIKLVHEAAQKEVRKLSNQGIGIPPVMADYIYKSKYADLLAERGTSAADAALAAKAAVAQRAGRSPAPSAAAPSGTPHNKIELSDDELDGSFKDLLRNPKLAVKQTA